MAFSSSQSTRILITVPLLVILAFQFKFAGTRLMGDVHARNGRVSVDYENWKEAIWYFERAVDWYPYNHHWWYGKAQAHQGLADTQKAVESFSQAHQIAPYDVSSIASLSYELHASSDIDQTLTLVDRGLALTPEFWSFHYTKGLLFLRVRDDVSAASSLALARRNAIEFFPQLERFNAYNSLRAEDLERASYIVETVVERGASVPEIWQLRGQIQHSNGNPEDAVPSYQRAISLYDARIADQPQRASSNARLRGETQAYLGFAHAAVNQDEAAIQQFVNSLDQYVDLKFFSESIGELHERMAADFGQRPADERAAWASVLSAAHMHDKAIQVFRAFDNDGAAAIPNLSRYYYANSLRATGDFANAIAQFQKMSELNWTQAMAYAETLVDSGQPAAARFEYNRILNLMPMTPQQRSLVEQQIAALG